MGLTLISHFWNEEFLLPYWLRHHYGMFDHGVLIDYASTDRSREIIRELAPNWQVRPSANAWFDARDADAEVMAVERECAGWKIVLNTTEFLICQDLRVFVADLERRRPEQHGVWPFDLTMVDAVAEREHEVTTAPLHFQKRWGYHSQGSRSRLLHRFPDGRYAAGRHSSEMLAKVLDDRLFILWFGWCPMRYIRERKLQIQQRIPQRDRAEGLSWHHLVSPEQLEDRYQREARKAYDLWEQHSAYRVLIEALAREATVGDRVEVDGGATADAR
jgi:hypothetical protein